MVSERWLSGRVYEFENEFEGKVHFSGRYASPWGKTRGVVGLVGQMRPENTEVFGKNLIIGWFVIDRNVLQERILLSFRIHTLKMCTFCLLTRVKSYTRDGTERTHERCLRTPSAECGLGKSERGG